jgi:hypothetical protein
LSGLADGSATASPSFKPSTCVRVVLPTPNVIFFHVTVWPESAQQ